MHSDHSAITADDAATDAEAAAAAAAEEDKESPRELGEGGGRRRRERASAVHEHIQAREPVIHHEGGCAQGCAVAPEEDSKDTRKCLENSSQGQIPTHEYEE